MLKCIKSNDNRLNKILVSYILYSKTYKHCTLLKDLKVFDWNLRVTQYKHVVSTRTSQLFPLPAKPTFRA